jgi:hypothetical protein
MHYVNKTKPAKTSRSHLPAPRRLASHHPHTRRYQRRSGAGAAWVLWILYAHEPRASRTACTVGLCAITKTADE